MIEHRGEHYAYQANTVRRTRVLSVLFLGKAVMAQGDVRFSEQELRLALSLVQSDLAKGPFP